MHDTEIIADDRFLMCDFVHAYICFVSCECVARWSLVLVNAQYNLICPNRIVLEFGPTFYSFSAQKGDLFANWSNIQTPKSGKPDTASVFARPNVRMGK